MEIRTKLTRVADLSHQFTELNDRFEGIFVEFKDVLFELQNKAERIEADPKMLAILNDKVIYIRFRNNNSCNDYASIKNIPHNHAAIVSYLI